MATSEPEAWQNAQRFRAAQGWLELGLLEEACAELEAVGAAVRQGAAGLDFQWVIFAERGHWDAAFAVAQQSVSLHPSVEGGWVNRAYAARRRTPAGLASAYHFLLPAHELFPESTIIPFNLSCYAAQLEQLEAAWSWIEIAAARAGWPTVGSMGLKDSDLTAFWPRIRESMGADL